MHPESFEHLKNSKQLGQQADGIMLAGAWTGPSLWEH